MVALNTAYAAPKNAADPKNRVGDFFYEDRASVGKNRWANRLNTQEKSCYHYETASGRSNWPNRDPIAEQGGLNLYGFLLNDGINLIDIAGLLGWGPKGPTYGNWGGGGWSGGEDGQQPPIDEYDNCFKGHDLCYEGCPDGTPDYSPCECKVNRAASRCREQASKEAREARTNCLKDCEYVGLRWFFLYLFYCRHKRLLFSFCSFEPKLLTLKYFLLQYMDFYS